MTRWTALMALKQGQQTKSRLAGVLDQAERQSLAESLSHQVLTALHAVEPIEEIRVLAPARVILPVALPKATWLRDEGGGLNAELERACAVCERQALLIVHADLPFLQEDDVLHLLAAAALTGVAIAADRHESGTNAIAMAVPAPRRFAFGAGSLARHRAIWPEAAIVRRPGLGFDLDTPQDLAEAERFGLVLPFARA